MLEEFGCSISSQAVVAVNDGKTSLFAHGFHHLPQLVLPHRLSREPWLKRVIRCSGQGLQVENIILKSILGDFQEVLIQNIYMAPQSCINIFILDNNFVLNFQLLEAPRPIL